MKTRLQLFFVFGLCLAITCMQAQDNNNKPQKASFTGNLNYKYVPSIKEQIKSGTFIPADPVGDSEKMGPPRRARGGKVVPGKGFPKEGIDPLAERQSNAEKTQIRGLSNSFLTSTSVATPSDPTGAVGRDYYVASWNTGWQIFNKDGSAIVGAPAASLATLFGEAPGDPIVLYDSAADRYIITQFSGNPNGFHVAVSQTNDPVNDGWHVYSSTDFQTGTFPDYTKFSIWSDAYYVTANIYGGTGQVFAIERDQMLDGDPAGIQAFDLPGWVSPPNGFYSPQVFNVTDDNLPATGSATVVIMQDDAYAGVTPGNDHLKLWEIDVDWATPINSTISAAMEFGAAEGVSPFTSVFDGGSFSNLQQPSGPDIDAIQATIMNQAQFRRFGTHNSAVFNFTVDVDAGPGKLAGVRWYEFRQTADGMPWTLYQEGTYVAPDGRHAWNASMAMDASGNIGMGYTSMSNTESVSLRYTGRFDGDPLGIMTGQEGLIAQSTGDSNSVRYADYSQLSVDPSDDATYYFVSEYFDPGRRDIVGVFTVDPPADDDVGVATIDAPNDGVLGAAETITVAVRNYGINPQSNIPISYTIDGGAAVNEVVPGPIGPGLTESFSFATTADLSTTDQTYAIVATTNLVGDGAPGNDSSSKNVTNALQYCEPSGDCSFGDGMTLFSLGTISNHVGVCGSGYNDSRGVSTDLDRASGLNVHNGTIQSGWDPEEISMWIDYNDDGDFDDAGEQVVNTLLISSSDTDTPFSITIPTDAPLGPHVLRIRGWDPNFQGGGLLNNPCDNMTYGNTEDLTINVVDTSLGIEDFPLDGSELKIISKANSQYEIILTSPYSDVITFNLYNAIGQKLVYNTLSKENNNEYRYELDMSYASTGIYIVEVGRGRNFKTGKIIVN